MSGIGADVFAEWGGVVPEYVVPLFFRLLVVAGS